MATVTPNFNWPVPTSTDLVKDGATAIEALGDSIDASLVDLKGGTSGQVLAKASGTDMDFAWVAQDDSNAIQNSIVNAKGDLIGASANDTPAILSVGSNGETLVADSSTSTGLRYTGTPSASNPILNSAFQIWQRGTSNVTTSLAYTADRWQKSSATHYGVSRQTTSDTTNLPFIQYCARMQRTAGSTSTTVMEIVQSVETVNSIPFSGKTVTMSFYARAGANYSPASSVLTAALYTGTSTDGNLLAGPWANAATPVFGNATLTTTWQRFSFTGTLTSTATQIAPYFTATPTGTAGANDFYEVTGVQIDIGSVALPFRTYAATIQGELAACQRYYYRNASGQIYGAIGFGMAFSTTQATFNIITPVPLRIVPTAAIEWGNLLVNLPGGGGTVPSSITMSTPESSFNQINIVAVTTGLTAYRPYVLINNNNTAGFFAVSAEL